MFSWCRLCPVNYVVKPDTSLNLFCSLQDALADLYRYLAITQRARGDMFGAEDSLNAADRKSGDKSFERIEELARLMAKNVFADMMKGKGEK